MLNEAIFYIGSITKCSSNGKEDSEVCAGDYKTLMVQ